MRPPVSAVVGFEGVPTGPRIAIAPPPPPRTAVQLQQKRDRDREREYARERAMGNLPRERRNSTQTTASGDKRPYIASHAPVELTGRGQFAPKPVAQ